MSLIRSRYVVSTRRGCLGVLFSALLALAGFEQSADNERTIRRNPNAATSFKLTARAN
jgi:hypothetical protein